jgi:hypothetical protein
MKPLPVKPAAPLAGCVYMHRQADMSAIYFFVSFFLFPPATLFRSANVNSTIFIDLTSFPYGFNRGPLRTLPPGPSLVVLLDKTATRQAGCSSCCVRTSAAYLPPRARSSK